jgi:hypothetical protein
MSSFKLFFYNILLPFTAGLPVGCFMDSSLYLGVLYLILIITAILKPINFNQQSKNYEKSTTSIYRNR